MPGAAPRISPGAKTSGASSPNRPTSAPSVTDQNNGDLLPFITALQAQLPAQGASTMSVAALLTYLQRAAPQVFAQLDKLVETARRVSGLDEAVAGEWKAQGNKAYAEQQLEQAVQIYTQGLLCAESDAMVATLLNNRSTAFFELHNYAAACLDADRALRYKADYWKALQRRGRALEELGMRDLGRKDCEAAAREEMGLANTPAAMQRVFGANTAQDALPPRLTTAAGIVLKEGAVCAKDTLAGGETVMEERPYALAARTEALLSVCAYCLQPATCLYQGDEYRRHGCKSRGLFCGETCATNAWDYFGQQERREVFLLCCPNDALLAWRLLRMMERFPDYVDTTTTTTTTNELLRGQVGPAAASLRRRQAASTHTRELDPSAGVGGVESVVAAIGLYMKAFSADEAEAMRWAQRNVLAHGVDVNYVLQLTTTPTAVSVSSSPAAAATLAGATQSNTVVVSGRAVYAFLPHFNHSCDPNCFVSFVGNPQSCSATVVVRAIRPIAADEELTVAYHGVTRFHFHSLQHRLQTLRERNGFVCHCPVCTAQLDEPVNAAEKEHYIKAADYYQKGCRMIREGKYRAAVTVLLQSYEILMRYICPPPRPPQSMLPKTHNALALAYYHLNDTAKAVEHLRAELELDIAIHGTDNRPEMIHNYARLAFLEATPAARAEFAQKAIELLTRFYAPSPSRELQISSLRHGLE